MTKQQEESHLVNAPCLTRCLAYSVLHLIVPPMMFQYSSGSGMTCPATDSEAAFLLSQTSFVRFLDFLGLPVQLPT